MLWAAYEKKAMDKALASGVQVVQVADKKPFQDAVKPVWDKYAGPLKSLIDRIQAVT